MDYACLLCNHFVEVTQPCPHCGQNNLENIGLLQDFYDSYSAYLDQESYQDGYRHYDADHCVHVLRCKYCGKEALYAYQRRTLGKKYNT